MWVNTVKKPLELSMEDAMPDMRNLATFMLAVTDKVQLSEEEEQDLLLKDIKDLCPALREKLAQYLDNQPQVNEYSK